MNILMFTNTFRPVVGGVAISIEAFAERYRDRGHHVLVVAPKYPDLPDDESDVIRVPAIKKLPNSRFAMPLPLDLDLYAELEPFGADVVHAHHPFLLGDTALRYAAAQNLPIVVTHHTNYEQFITNVPEPFVNFVQSLATGHANQCDAVIAPTGSIRELLQEHGVEAPIHVLPTGIEVDRFANGDGAAMRRELDIPEDAFVFGHVGRLAPEKNLEFLGKCLVRALEEWPEAHVLVVGDGTGREAMEAVCMADEALRPRMHFTGQLTGDHVPRAYAAMDCFAFASHSDTQGIVLLEAMAAGAPPVALKSPGAVDQIEDGQSGALVDEETVDAFVAGLQRVHDDHETFVAGGRERASGFSIDECAERTCALYEELVAQQRDARDIDQSPWAALARRVEQEWNIWSSRANAVADMVNTDPPEET